MNKPVKERIDARSKTYGWDTSYMGRELYQKDGYEVYFFGQNDGFELTVRNPETREREAVLEVRDEDIDTSSPLYVAVLEHVLMNAETIVSNAR